MKRTRAFEDAYPEALWALERRYLQARMERPPLAGDRPSEDVLGFALSGGGIRSATFCLGIFQALASLRRLRRIDYISTVSGGGYFGSFLGRLYQRREVTTVEQVEALLDPAGTAAERPDAIPDVVAWLRENGRYLSPNGAGDLLIGAAITLRNWVTIHVVVLSFALLTLMTGQLLRVNLEGRGSWFDRGTMDPERWLWWSPWIALPGVLFLWGAIPLAWAFWMTGLWRGRRSIVEWPVWGVVAMAGLAIALVAGWEPLPRLDWWRQVGRVTLIAITLTGVAWAVFLYLARRGSRLADFPSPESQKIFEIDRQRNLLSTYLKVTLVLGGASLVFALIDSIGQTLYLLRMQSGGGFGGLYAVLGSLMGAFAFAQRIATALAGKTNGARLRLPVAAIVTAVALLLVALLLVSLSVLAHAVSWQFQPPSSQPRGHEFRQFVLIVWSVLLVFSVLFGHCWPFINQSSLHSMYSARLTRAYLGASNPRRTGVHRERITDVMPGDNIDPADYWPGPPEPGARDPKGRPLHLINVTINETVDGRSNVQQQDRKGTGLALGPCSYSVGIRHHAVFPGHQVFRAPSDERGQAEVIVFPRPSSEDQTSAYRVFAAESGPSWPGGESLSIGKWTGISGAAFSTGIGSRTSLGLSLLCGLANVRLGYWWHSGVEPAWRSGGRRPWLLEKIFSVQSNLLSEFLSRFHGTSRSHWYLSDGGHFENLGGYELIRRRLRRIVIIDAEADPGYSFEGLANLIRKARLDFGAEIRFMNTGEIETHVPKEHQHLFGSLEQLRRGKWTEEPVKDRLADLKRLTVDEPVDEARLSLAHAALARVTYIDEPTTGERAQEPGWLLYIKPTLIGNEPSDILQYHRAHRHFPQETTADQFFDEAQWESYRALGYHIGYAVFGPGEPTAPGAANAVPSPAELIFGPGASAASIAK
jgi:hypothetical protein